MDEHNRVGSDYVRLMRALLSASRTLNRNVELLNPFNNGIQPQCHLLQHPPNNHGVGLPGVPNFYFPYATSSSSSGVSSGIYGAGGVSADQYGTDTHFMDMDDAVGNLGTFNQHFNPNTSLSSLLAHWDNTRHRDGVPMLDETSFPLPGYGQLAAPLIRDTSVRSGSGLAGLDHILTCHQNHFTTEGNYISQPFQPVGSRWFDNQFVNLGEASGSAWPQMSAGPSLLGNNINVNPLETPSMARRTNRSRGSAPMRRNNLNVNPIGRPSMARRNRSGSGRLRRNQDDADPHQDMRMDVDNMSYEELLALGELIGKVNVGASEEAIRSQLEIKVYSKPPAETVNEASVDKEPECCNECRIMHQFARLQKMLRTFSTSQADSLDSTSPANSLDEKPECCICQEEYKDGDEIGILNCKHEYHKDCLAQWLREKNVCPICNCEALAPSLR